MKQFDSFSLLECLHVHNSANSPREKEFVLADLLLVVVDAVFEFAELYTRIVVLLVFLLLKRLQLVLDIQLAADAFQIVQLPPILVSQVKNNLEVRCTRYFDCRVRVVERDVVVLQLGPSLQARAIRVVHCKGTQLLFEQLIRSVVYRVPDFHVAVLVWNVLQRHSLDCNRYLVCLYIVEQVERRFPLNLL